MDGRFCVPSSLSSLNFPILGDIAHFLISNPENPTFFLLEAS
jgi:hypothetical protein